MFSLARPEKRDRDEAASRAGTRKVAEAGAQTLPRQVTTVSVVGPPGCCGCVGKSVSSPSRRLA